MSSELHCEGMSFSERGVFKKQYYSGEADIFFFPIREGGAVGREGRKRRGGGNISSIIIRAFNPHHVTARPMGFENGLDDSDGRDVSGVKLSAGGTRSVEQQRHLAAASG